MLYIQEQQIRILYQLSPPNYVLSLIAASILTFVFWGVIDRVFLLAWVLWFFISTSARAYINIVFVRRAARSFDPLFWGRVYAFGALVAGCTWSAIALQFDAQWSGAHQVILWTTLAGLISGSVSTHSYYFPALTAFYAPLLVTFTYLGLSQTDLTYYWLVTLVMVFWGIVHVAGRRFQGVLIASLEVKHSLEVANKKLAHLSSIDSLTKLFNRGALDGYLSEQWALAEAEQVEMTIVMLDVDYFKDYNDAYGHVEGDACLVAIAELLSQSLEDLGGYIARYGGEEFILVLPGADESVGLAWAEQVKSLVAQAQIAHKQSQVSQYLTCSFGVASIVPGEDSHYTALVIKADNCLYQAKKSGRNCIVVHSLGAVEALGDVPGDLRCSGS